MRIKDLIDELAMWRVAGRMRGEEYCPLDSGDIQAVREEVLRIHQALGSGEDLCRTGLPHPSLLLNFKEDGPTLRLTRPQARAGAKPRNKTKTKTKKG